LQLHFDVHKRREGPRRSRSEPEFVEVCQPEPEAEAGPRGGLHMYIWLSITNFTSTCG